MTFDFFVASPADPGPCDSTNDFLEVTVDGTQVFLYDCTFPIDEYTQQSADISAFADGLAHQITVRGKTNSTNTENTNFFVDNFSIPLPAAAVPTPSECFELPTACAPVETFSSGIPPSWTVLNLGADPADGWGTTEDGICLTQNAAPHASEFGDNLTSGTGGAACADSDATGRIDVDGGGSATEMDTYLCAPAYDLSNITAPRFSFFANYQAADNRLNDNGTPDDPTDDFDEDFLEVLVGTAAPNALTVPSYTSLGTVNDHEEGSLVLTGAQELSASLQSTLGGQPEGYVCLHYRGTYAWFAQIDNAALRGTSCTSPDFDGDGIPDDVDPDDDNDGIDDIWEEFYNLNPKDASDAGLDPDEDGLTSLEEFNIDQNLDPHDPDTDGDGIGDALDTELFNPFNTCTGGDLDNAVFAAAVDSLRTCAARVSIGVVSPPTVVTDPGHLTLISELVTFESGFSAGGLTVISADPCPNC